MLNKLKSLWSDSLYRNSFWLMAGSFSMAGIGFVYWIIAARLYTPEQIGLATTFLSAASLVNGFAMLGFGTTLIRFLPTSEVKEKKINTAFTVVSTAAFLIGLLYLFGLPTFTNKLLFIRASIPTLLIAIFFFPLNTINGITDSVFIAFRQAQWVFVSNISQSIIKFIFLFLFSSLGVWGVIGSNIVATVIATSLCLILISRLYSIHFKPTLDEAILKSVRKFALGNYASGLIGSLPNMLLPIIITNRISPEQTAYFYMPNMIAGLLTMIPSTISRSYLTESSHSTSNLSLKKPLLISYSLLIPSILFLVTFGRQILSLFGKSYSVAGYYYLVVMCVSILIMVINYFLGVRLMVNNRLKAMVISNSIGSAVYISSALFAISYGIVGIAISSIISQSAILITSATFVYKHSSKNEN